VAEAMAKSRTWRLDHPGAERNFVFAVNPHSDDTHNNGMQGPASVACTTTLQRGRKSNYGGRCQTHEIIVPYVSRNDGAQ
jgi:hypothetical protein